MKNINYVVLLQKIMTGDNLNQSQLASILGVSKQYVYDELQSLSHSIIRKCIFIKTPNPKKPIT